MVVTRRTMWSIWYRSCGRILRGYVSRCTRRAPIERRPRPRRGERFVVKLGGEIMLNAPGLDALAADIAAPGRQGHARSSWSTAAGRRPMRWPNRLGHTVRKVAGRRVTDDDALEVAKMVYGGSINMELLAALTRHGARGVGALRRGRRPDHRHPPPATHHAKTRHERPPRWSISATSAISRTWTSTLLDLLLRARLCAGGRLAGRRRRGAASTTSTPTPSPRRWPSGAGGEQALLDDQCAGHPARPRPTAPRAGPRVIDQQRHRRAD